ncbi:MAG: AfsR/SARP family transcriptional regulator, partial [Mycobacteriales bacterium]
MTRSSISAPGLRLEFRLLGPVEVHDRGTGVELGGSKPTGLLTLLLLSANRPVSTAALIDGLWGDAPPRTAGKMIQVFVSRIRRQLGDAGAQLRTTASGYQLVVDREDVDLFRFEALQREAAEALDGDPERASASVKEALALWRGPALANVSAEPFAEAAAARLEELRLGALELHVDAELAAGRHRTIIADLQQLVTTWPTRERFGEQLMLALYRCGRQADALATAQEIRVGLRESLGIDPGPRLAQLELAILRQDPTLDLSPAQDTVGRPPVAPDGPLPMPPDVIAAPPRRHRSRRLWAATAVALTGVILLVVFMAP